MVGAGANQQEELWGLRTEPRGGQAHLPQEKAEALLRGKCAADARSGLQGAAQVHIAFSRVIREGVQDPYERLQSSNRDHLHRGWAKHARDRAGLSR